MHWFRGQRRPIQFGIGCGALLMACVTLACVAGAIGAVFDDEDEADDSTSTDVIAAQQETRDELSPTVPSQSTMTPTAEPTATEVPPTAEPTMTPTATEVPATPTPTDTPVPPTATSLPTATPLPYKLPREYAAFDDGFQVTVTEWHEIEFPEGSMYGASVGMQYIFINTQSCAGRSEVSVSPGDFQLELPNNRRANFTIALGVSDEGDLHVTRIAPGDCVQGYVTFEIPDDIEPLFVLYNGFLRDQIKFQAVKGE